MARAATDRFVDALQALEEGADVRGVASLFTDDAELRTSAVDRPRRGRRGAQVFWTAYRRAFQEVRSEFRHVIESGGIAMLEWESRGRAASGGEFRYAGVSVLEFDGDRIRRFRSYFDARGLADRIEAQRPRRVPGWMPDGDVATGPAPTG